MVLTIDGKIGSLPISLKVDFGSDELVGEAIRSLALRASGGEGLSTAGWGGASEPAAAPKRKRRPPQTRITRSTDGRIEVSAPEMTMLRHLPGDSKPMGLPDLAEKVWPGRTARDGGPLVGPAARVAGGLLKKGLATIEGTGGDKMVTAVADWEKKAVEVQK